MGHYFIDTQYFWRYSYVYIIILNFDCIYQVDFDLQ